jgi:hypothetical protein
LRNVIQKFDACIGLVFEIFSIYLEFEDIVFYKLSVYHNNLHDKQVCIITGWAKIWEGYTLNYRSINMKLKVMLYSAILVILLSGCTATLPQYSPILSVNATGEICVEKFRYLPGDEGKRPKDELGARGDVVWIKVLDSVSSYVTDAFIKEAKFAGLRIREDSKIVVGGQILDYYFQQGIPQHYVAEITFEVYHQEENNRRLLYSRTHKGEITAQGAFGPTNVFEIALARAIESFIKDAQKEKIF